MKNTLCYRFNYFLKFLYSTKIFYFKILVVTTIHINGFVSVTFGQVDSLNTIQLEQLVNQKKNDEAISFYREVNENISSFEEDRFVRIHELGVTAYLKGKPKNYRQITLSIYEKLLTKIRAHKNRDEWIFMAGRLEALLVPTNNHYDKIRVYEKSVSDLPETHKGRGFFYQRIARAYLALYDYDNFLKYSQEAENFYDNKPHKNTFKHTQVLNTLGFAYRLTGQISNSKETFEDAKKIKIENEIEDDQFGKITNQLGSVYLLYDDFKKAKENLTLSLRVKARKGRNTNSYANSLSSYAHFLQSAKRLDIALDTINECISIAQLVKDTINILDYLQLKADILTELNSTEEAIVIYENLKEKRRGLRQEENSNHPKVLYNLFDLYIAKKDYGKAKQLIEEACLLFEKIHGKKHPYYAKALIKKAEVALAQGEQLDYVEIYDTSSEILESIYGKKLDYFNAKFALFKFYKNSNQDKAAITMLKELDEVIQRHIKRVASYISNQEITNLYRNYFQEVVSLAAQNQENEYLRKFVLKCSLFYKGYILKRILTIKKLVRNSPRQNENKVRLMALEEDLARAILTVNEDLTTRIRKKIAVIENEMEEINSGLNATNISLYSFNEKLSDKTVMIDFIRYYNEDMLDFEYIAILLRKEDDVPTYLPLFFEKEFTKYFDNNPNSVSLARDLYARSSTRGIVPTKERDTLSLNELIWQKLAPSIDGMEKIYYSADGLLHNIAFHAIVLGADKVVADKYQLVQITNLNTLLEEDNRYYEKSALIIGGLDYGDGEIVAATGFRRSGQPWGELKHSKKEIDTINTLLYSANYKIEVLSDKQADKKSLYFKLRQENDLRIIHFATHGFFLTDSLLGVKPRFLRNMTDIDLNRSALVLTNANVEGERAYLTASEISDCNLENTELVVLSACETGLGQVYQNEGVYGLQRAFKIAGVKYIIMSLWEINDLQAKEFMESLYANYLDEYSIENAFYKTQKERINNKSIEWAGFVLLR